MTNALQLLPNPVNQYVLLPEVDDCLCPFLVEMIDDVGARVKNRVVQGCGEMQVFVPRRFLVESKKAIMLPLFLLRERYSRGTVQRNVVHLILQTLWREDVLVIGHVLDCYRTSCLIGDCTVRVDKSRYERYKLTGSPAWYDSREAPALWHCGRERNLHVSV